MKFLEAIARGACLIIALSGCLRGKDRWVAGRPPVVKAAGTVMHNGQPVSDAIVTLFPVSGTHSSYGRTDASGKFTLTTFDSNDGAVAGNYQVTISKTIIEYEANPADPERLPPLYHAEQFAIPEHYGDVTQSGLTATIPEGGTTTLRFELLGEAGQKRILVPRKGA